MAESPGMPEPTGEQCAQHAAMPDGWTACWYPRMGGYHGKAVARADGDGCVDVLVWHDGLFPFGGEDEARPDRSPVELHHCEGDGFERFGRFLTVLSDRGMADQDASGDAAVSVQDALTAVLCPPDASGDALGMSRAVLFEHGVVTDTGVEVRPGVDWVGHVQASRRTRVVRRRVLVVEDWQDVPRA